MSAKYPNELANLTTSSGNETPAKDTHPKLHNDANAEINAIQEILGVKPQEWSGTVKELLAYMRGTLQDLGEVQGLTSLKPKLGRQIRAKLKGATEFELKELPSGTTELNLFLTPNGFNWSIKNVKWIGNEPTFNNEPGKTYEITLLVVEGGGEILAINSQGPQGERGLEGTSYRPWLDTNGLNGWTFDPVSRSTGSGVEKERLFLHKILVTPGSTLAKLLVQVETKGETLTSGQCLAGIYSQTGKLLGKTGDQSAVWNSTGFKEMALTAQSEESLKLGEGVKWVYGALLANGTTPPAFAIQASQSGAPLVNAGLSSALGWRGGLYNVAGQTSLPAEINMENITSQAAVRWMGLV